MTILYRVRAWTKRFENNRTRELKHMDWVPVPNQHDGDGFTDLMSRENGTALYGAWMLILQIASKCVPRGELVRDNPAPSCGMLRGDAAPSCGTVKLPHDAASIARMTRSDTKTVAAALRACCDIGWLEEIPMIDPLSGNPVIIPHNPAPSCGTMTMEGKGREGKGREEEYIEGASPKNLTAIPTEEEVIAQGGIIGLSEQDCRDWFKDRTAEGWCDRNGVDIGNWRAWLTRHRDYRKTAKVTPATSGAARKPFLSELRTQLEVKRELRKKIENRGHNDPTGGLIVMAKDKPEFKRLNQEIGQLLHAIDQYDAK